MMMAYLIILKEQFKLGAKTSVIFTVVPDTGSLAALLLTIATLVPSIILRTLTTRYLPGSARARAFPPSLSVTSEETVTQ